jgi:diketogulonate reductase-like aldo/keto reductase
VRVVHSFVLGVEWLEFKTFASGLTIPSVGFGTWDIGGGMTADRTRDEEAISVIGAAIKLGVTHIDTAELYGDGHAEELVGEAIRELDRKALFVTTKVKWSNLHYKDVMEAAKRSLKRLRTDYVDLYLIHTPNESVPIQETMRAMDDLADAKMTRFIGVSNFSVEQMEKAQRASRHKIVANQIEYNLLTRNSGMHTTDMETSIIPYCQKEGVAVIAYRPLAKGELARPGFALLDEFAQKYGKTQAQIAINWLISKPNIVTIPKTMRIERVKENLGAIGWKLSAEDSYRLDREFPIRAY